ncbi:MAG: membrane dipeptidase [Proteobacteria bacterium]|nr:membrane dipeptidase [Pseudomonadota bacterium]MBI3499349.1 membrane dipeptidase [Pseudomonadota bacterium]
MTGWTIEPKATALHSALTLCDMTLPWTASALNSEAKTLPRFPKAGVTFVSLSLGVDSMGLETTIRHIAAERRRFLSHPGRYVLVETVADIRRAKAEGMLAIGFNFQGTNPLAGDTAMVEVYYKLGIRHMLLAYNQRNLAADGCHERTDGGLSRFGVALIEAMNRVGMIVDVTHTGYRSSMEAMEVSTAPVIFSHSNARALKDHERNIRDDQIDACAKTGGLIGINGVGPFLGENDGSTAAYVRHVDYMVQRVGAAHVGIGLDMVDEVEFWYAVFRGSPAMFPKGYPPPPWQFVQPEQLPEVTEALMKLGYGERDVRGVMGENFLRVAAAVWK